MAFYIKAVRARLLDSSMSDEELVRSLFTPFIEAGRVYNKNDEILDLNKSRVSRLLMQKDDIPKAMRIALPRVGLYEKTIEGLYETIEDFIGEDRIDSLVQELNNEIEISDNLEETKQKFRLLIGRPKDYLCSAFFEAIRLNNCVSQSMSKCLWSRGDNSLCYTTGDLFHYRFNKRKKQKSIIVIPVNTAFDTHISWPQDCEPNPVVSPQTLHGMWLNRWFHVGGNEEELRGQIANSLNAQRLQTTTGCEGHNLYPIGTIAEVSDENTVYYLLSISEFDSHNVAGSSADDIRIATEAMLEHYNCRGQGVPLFMPLLGTGLSRAAMDYRSSFSLIQRVLLEHKDQLYGKVTIVVKEDAMKEILEDNQ